jgi:hypothetical protein
MKMFVLIFCISIAKFTGYAQNPQAASTELTSRNVKDIFNFIFDNDKADFLTITEEDKQKATTLFTDLIDKSCAMGKMEKITKAIYFNKPSFKKIVKAFFKAGIMKCDSEKYYDAVRTSLARNFKSAYAIRVQTGEW